MNSKIVKCILQLGVSLCIALVYRIHLIKQWQLRECWYLQSDDNTWHILYTSWSEEDSSSSFSSSLSSVAPPCCALWRILSKAACQRQTSNSKKHRHTLQYLYTKLQYAQWYTVLFWMHEVWSRLLSVSITYSWEIFVVIAVHTFNWIHHFLHILVYPFLSLFFLSFNATL